MIDTLNISLAKAQTHSMSEKDLIEAAKKNPEDFRVLYDRYFPQIFGFAYNRTGDKQTSADITSQVFLKALLGLKKFKYRGVPFSAWLIRIAMNECTQYFRDFKKNRVVVLDEQFSGLLIEEVTDAWIEKEQQYEQLEKVMSELETSEIQLLELRFFERRPFKEVAFILGLSENNTKGRLYRLLSKIKRKIKNQ